MKSSNSSKILISVLLIIPILILYFNFDILKFFKLTSEKETFNNYINVCKSKASQFYNVNNDGNNNTYSINPNNKSECKYHCFKDKCDFYTVKDGENNNCITYSNNGDNFNASIDCNSKSITDSESTNTYYGEGYIDSEFYKNNKEKFNYLDYELEKTNELIKAFNNVNTELNRPDLREIQLNTADFTEWNTNLQNNYNDIGTLSSHIGKYLDMSKNSLYSELVDTNYSVDLSGNFILGDKKYDYYDMLNEINNNSNNNKLLVEKDIQTNKTLEYNFSFYIALIIIIIISAIVLVIYNITNNLSEIFLIVYFSSIAFLLLFLHFILKI